MVKNVFQRADSDSKLKAILEDPTIPHADVSRRTGVSETSVRRYRTARKISLAPIDPDWSSFDVSDVPDQETIEARNRQLEKRNKRLYESLLQEKRKAERLIEAVYSAAQDAAEHAGTARSVPAPPKDKRSKRAESVIWHTTDWQRAKETNDFNSEICDARVDVFTQKAQDLTDIMRADHPMRHGVVLATGDMLEGCKIFPGQEWEVDADLFEQMFGGAELFERVIKTALACYEDIDVICEWGNHGRIGKPSDGFKKSDNFDRIMYEIVRRRFRHEERIKNFQVSGDWYQHFSIGNYQAMAIHGDEIKGFGGNVPAYGILRKANAWSSGVVEPFRDLYLGHFHQSMQLSLANGGSVFMTGSVESGNEYAREFVAATNEPSQRVNFVDPEKGIVTFESRVWLT